MGPFKTGWSHRPAPGHLPKLLGPPMKRVSSFGQWCRAVLPGRAEPPPRPRRSDAWNPGMPWAMAPPAAPDTQAASDDEAEAGWHASSAALASGLQVTEWPEWPVEEAGSTGTALAPGPRDSVVVDTAADATPGPAPGPAPGPP
jgi:hypothetical protein